jgi:hypothetical protein
MKFWQQPARNDKLSDLEKLFPTLQRQFSFQGQERQG